MVSSLKTSEQEMKDQINILSDQFQSKEKLILKKQTDIIKLKSEINPIKPKFQSWRKKIGLT